MELSWINLKTADALIEFMINVIYYNHMMHHFMECCYLSSSIRLCQYFSAGRGQSATLTWLQYDQHANYANSVTAAPWETFMCLVINERLIYIHCK